jgi:hypothetical protein
MNCHECHHAIESAIELYGALRELETAGYDASELSVQLKQIVATLLDRVAMSVQPPPICGGQYSASA